MTFLIFGHRGSPRRARENTLASFEEALRGGADGFETDLRLLADGSIVLFHDDELGDAAIESLTAAEVAVRGGVAQPLRDLDPLAARASLMVLEVKRGGWEDVLVAAVSRWPNIVVASFDHTLIAALAARPVPFPLGITVSGKLVDHARYATSIGATWSFPKHHYVDAALVDSLHEAGIRVVPWTANRVREWERLREIGCDGVITDVPGDAVGWRSEP